MKIQLNKKIYMALLILLLFTMLDITSFKVYSELDEGYYTGNGIKSIKIAVDPAMPPLQYMEENEFKGFHIDILESVGAMQDIDINYVPMPLEVALKAVKTGEIDAILGVNYLAQLSEELIFTENISNSSVGLIVKKNNEKTDNDILELTNMIIAVKRYSVEYQHLQNIRSVKYNTTSNMENAFYLLKNQRGDSLMGDKLVSQYFMEKYNLNNAYRFVNSYIIPIEYSIAIYKDNNNLLYKLNTGIQQVKASGIYGEHYDKWFGHQVLIAQQQLQRLLKIFGGFVIIASILFILGVRWNKQLKNQVDKKTKQLQMMNKYLAYQIKETKNKNELIDQVLESSPRGLITVDIDGKINSCNPTAIELIGIQNNPIGRHYSEISFFQQLLEEKAQDVIEKEVQFSGDEINWKRQDGKEYDIRYIVYPLRSYDKTVKGIIVSFEDITEEKKLREEWFEREKSKALNEIVAGISHEIRNPLTSIKTFVELIPKKFNNPQFQKDITAYVPKEVERVDQLIESLINYAKPRKPNKEIVDVGDLVEYNIRLFTPTIEQKGFKVVMDVEKGLKIEVDKAQMKQVIMNFILNGIEAMEEAQQEKNEGQTLTIRGWRQNEYVYLAIIDEGVGMTQKEIIDAINPFYTTKAGGTGLGIPLSKQYVEDNNGHLTIESEKNVGTKLILRFEGR